MSQYSCLYKFTYAYINKFLLSRIEQKVMPRSNRSFSLLDLNDAFANTNNFLPLSLFLIDTSQLVKRNTKTLYETNYNEYVEGVNIIKQLSHRSRIWLGGRYFRISPRSTRTFVLLIMINQCLCVTKLKVIIIVLTIIIVKVRLS